MFPQPRVVEEDPIKQGLKHDSKTDDRAWVGVVEEDPIKQGLKHYTTYETTYNTTSCRGRSNKTRIETTGYWLG